MLTSRIIRDLRGDHSAPRSPARRSPAWSWLLAIPFLASACISVTQSPDPGATPTPSVAPSLAAPSASPPPTPAPTPLPVPTPTSAPVDAEVVGFLPYWQLEDAAKALDSDLLTVVAFHGVEASADGRLVSKKPSGDVPEGWLALESDAFLDLKEQLQADGVKVVLTIQRFGWTSELLERTRTLLTSKKDRRSLATRMAAFVEERGFDGVSLDVEPVPEDLADEYVAFVREVRAALDEVDPALHLSVDVVPGLTGYDLAGLTAADAADLAIIMGYNYRTDAAAVAGSTAPLEDPRSGDLLTTVQAALEQVPGEKLVLALPWFGKAWPTETDRAGSATVSGEGIDGSASPSYAEAVELATQYGRQYDAGQASAWTAYPARQCGTCPATWRQAWYDDPDSFGAKIDFALDQGLAGVGMWALGHEAGREDLWWALRERLVPQPSDSAPPNGTASLDPESIQGDLDGQSMIDGAADLRLFASDGDDGSGLFLVRVGLADGVDADGQLIVGRSYPAIERLAFPLGDEETGGSADPGPRSIHVQWRDLAGNWSLPVVVEAYVMDPVGSTTPDDL
jgi:spore germination protein YaaH